MKTPDPKAKLARLKRQADRITPATSPIASARLQKLQLEIRRLKHEVESARLDAEIRAGRLLSLDDAQALYCRPLQTIRDALGSLAKRFAVRLHGQPIKTIESMLADEADRIVKLARESL